jgi:hypothetical protein
MSKLFPWICGNGWDVKKYISEQIHMNIMERNNKIDSYRPRTICTGYTGDLFIRSPYGLG